MTSTHADSPRRAFTPDAAPLTESEPSGLPQRPGLAGLFHLGVLYVVWSSTYLAIKLAVRPGAGFPPFLMGGTRLLLAGAVLLGWAILRRQPARLNRAALPAIVSAGLLLWLGGNGLVTWAEQRADSGYAALLIGASPIWATVVESLMNRRLPSRHLVGALLIGFAGLAVLTAPKLLGGARADVLSILALLAAPMCWATGSVSQQRRPPVGLSSSAGSGYQLLCGGLAMLLVSWLTHEPAAAPTTEAWLAWGYLVFIGSVFAYTSFVAALRLLPVTVVMTYAYVNPVFGAILGSYFLHEKITTWTFVGGALLVAGVAGVFRDKYR